MLCRRDALADTLADTLIEAVRAASTSGLNTAALVSAAIATVAAIISLTRLRHIPPTGQSSPAEDKKTVDEATS